MHHPFLTITGSKPEQLLARRYRLRFARRMRAKGSTMVGGSKPFLGWVVSGPGLLRVGLSAVARGTALSR